jgi:sec-independent protein translocase protein TatC
MKSGSDAKYMSFWEHLEEFRWVLLKTIAALVIGTGIGLAFTSSTYQAMQLPVRLLDTPVELIFTGPLDPFLVRLKLGLLTGVVLALPFILLFVWQFAAPGLKSSEMRLAWVAAGAGTFFFIIGAGFGYLVLIYGLPGLIALGFAGEDIRHLWPLSTYLSFCLRLLLAFGAVFELPVVTVALARLGLVTAAALRRVRPYAVILIFILAAVLTPPDALTQIMLGVPLLVLYEASIFITGLIERH